MDLHVVIQFPQRTIDAIEDTSKTEKDVESSKEKEVNDNANGPRDSDAPAKSKRRKTEKKTDAQAVEGDCTICLENYKNDYAVLQCVSGSAVSLIDMAPWLIVLSFLCRNIHSASRASRNGVTLKIVARYAKCASNISIDTTWYVHGLSHACSLCCSDTVVTPLYRRQLLLERNPKKSE